MFYDEHTAEIRRRYVPRSEWPWECGSKEVCKKCRRVSNGNNTKTCSRCSSLLGTVETIPAKGLNKWKKLKFYPYKPDLYYPTATPRRFPTSGAPPKLKAKKR